MRVLVTAAGRHHGTREIAEPIATGLVRRGLEADAVPVLTRLTQAIGRRALPGRLDLRRLHFAERAVARTIHASEGEDRDWDAIDRFAGEIADDSSAPA
jgi:menaquinone-dependent protoporphyrinogen IX oxidase